MILRRALGEGAHSVKEAAAPQRDLRQASDSTVVSMPALLVPKNGAAAAAGACTRWSSECAAAAAARLVRMSCVTGARPATDTAGNRSALLLSQDLHFY